MSDVVSSGVFSTDGIGPVDLTQFGTGGDPQACLVDVPGMSPFPQWPSPIVQPQFVPVVMAPPVIVQPTSLSDADVDRIARRVVELLRQERP